MGYTHYWYTPSEEFDQEKWDEFVKDCKLLYKNMPENSHSSGAHYSENPLILNGCFLHKDPVFSKKKVYFNGGKSKERRQVTGEDGRKNWEDVDEDINSDLGHETFVLLRKPVKSEYVTASPRGSLSFGCCKTARKPYDLMVEACLILFKIHFPEVEVSTDGEFEDWEEAFKFVGNTIPKGKEKALELLMNPYDKGGIFERVYEQS